jgi:phosphatidylinositol glycan class M
LFAGGDLLAGWLVGRVLRLRGVGERAALAAAAAWLFNPFTVTVSTRGSCESLVSTLMLVHPKL